MTTKQDEMNALKEIRKIIASLGENSYIGIAFEGCLEDADQNIANDFACSWKQRAEAREEEAEKAHEKMRDAERRYNELLKDKELLTASVDRLNKEVLKYSNAEIEKVNELNESWQENEALKRDNERLTSEIIRLKAKLYDLLEEKHGKAV